MILYSAKVLPFICPPCIQITDLPTNIPDFVKLSKEALHKALILEDRKQQ